MKRIFALAWIAALTMPVSVVAKGPTSRITIVDTVRGTSIEITDPTVLSRFKVWDGPGTYRERMVRTPKAWMASSLMRSLARFSPVISTA